MKRLSVRGVSQLRNFSRMHLSPFDRVFQMVERSGQSLRDEIWNMRRNLFALEPITAMEKAMSDMMKTIDHMHSEFGRPRYRPIEFPKDAFEVGKDGKVSGFSCLPFSFSSTSRYTSMLRISNLRI